MSVQVVSAEGAILARCAVGADVPARVEGAVAGVAGLLNPMFAVGAEQVVFLDYRAAPGAELDALFEVALEQGELVLLLLALPEVEGGGGGLTSW